MLSGVISFFSLLNFYFYWSCAAAPAAAPAALGAGAHPPPTARGGRGRGIPVLPSLLPALAGTVPEHLAFPSASDALEVTLPSLNSPPCLLFAIIKEKKTPQKTQGFPTHMVLVMLALQGPRPLASPRWGDPGQVYPLLCIFTTDI